MRQIKFRGKRKDTGKWLFGDLVRNENGEKQEKSCAKSGITAKPSHVKNRSNSKKHFV